MEDGGQLSVGLCSLSRFFTGVEFLMFWKFQELIKQRGRQRNRA